MQQKKTKKERAAELKKALDAVDAIFEGEESKKSLEKNATTLSELSEGSQVLVTGSTGFVGMSVASHILKEYPKLSVVTLVRKKAQVMDGCEAVVGDLSKPLLGLDAETFSSLSSRISVVIHCAAAVNLVAVASTLWPVNVGGTIELLKLRK